jgi:hypothetical protein
MSSPIKITADNRVNSNTFTTQLTSSLNLSEYEAALGSFFIYYSWFNISDSLNNRTFQLTVPTSSTSLNLTVTLDPGAYSINDLNNALQYYLISQGLYITNNTTGQNTYYCAFSISPTSYSVTFTTTPLPTSLPAGYTSGGMTFPSVSNQHYQLTVLSSNNFKDIIGFNAGTYPSVPTNVGTYTKKSDYVPNVNPISTIEMRLSCLYNECSTNTQLFHVFSNKGAVIGELIDASPLTLEYTRCQGIVNNITIQFFDNRGNPLELLDPNVTIKIYLRKIT